MDNLVTLNKLINISDDIVLIANENNSHNLLLDEFIYNQYDVLEIKKKLEILFSKFKSARYLYDFPIEESIKITPNLEFREDCIQKSTISQIENAVERYIDKRILTTDIYNSLIKISYKLIDDEATYLTNTFITHESEEHIAEFIGISKTYLQKIKKSCIVKMWVELERYCIKDD